MQEIVVQPNMDGIKRWTSEMRTPNKEITEWSLEGDSGRIY